LAKLRHLVAASYLSSLGKTFFKALRPRDNRPGLVKAKYGFAALNVFLFCPKSFFTSISSKQLGQIMILGRRVNLELARYPDSLVVRIWHFRPSVGAPQMILQKLLSFSRPLHRISSRAWQSLSTEGIRYRVSWIASRIYMLHVGAFN